MSSRIPAITKEVTTPDDADLTHIVDVSDTTDHASGSSGKLTWANTKATLKTYFDSLYSAVSHTHTESDVTDLDHTDTDAIHDDTAGEINAVTSKATPISGDLILIEDSADSNNKKKITVGSLPTGGGGEANTASNVGTAGVGVFKQKTSVDFEFKKINAGSNKITITDDTGDDEIDIDVDDSNLSVTESQISDLQSYLLDITGEPLSTLSDVTITSIASGELLKWNGSAWINNTLAEAGIAATSHTHTESDISDLGTYQVELSEGAFIDGDKSKLDGIETGATVDQSDSEIETAYNNQVDVISQVEAETGTATTVRRWTAQRVKQAIEALESGGGASQLSDLSDVGTTTATDKNALMADGDSWESRAIVEADISDLGTYQVELSEGAFVDGDKTKLNGIETGADVTDTANVTSAGALMDSEVDADIKTLSLPASTTISTFGASLVDDTTSANARTTLDVDQAGTDNSTDVTLAGTPDYITIAGQVITRNQIDLTADVTGILPEANLPNASTTAEGVVELATTTEINTGTDTSRAVTPDALQASKRNIRWLVFNLVEAGTDCAVATNIGGDFVSPIAGVIQQSDSTPFYLYATNSTAGTTGNMVVDINIGGTSIMTTNKLSFDTTEKTTTTAATPPDLTTTALAVGDIISIDTDSIHTTAAKGLTVYIGVLET